jgi:hypothetical protein
MAAAVSFAQDILPLFTATDVQHMQRMGVELAEYSFMSTPANAKSVYEQLLSKKMPPSFGGGDGPWSDTNIALFKSWVDGGYQP